MMEFEALLRQHAANVKDSMAAPFHTEMEAIIMTNNTRRARYNSTKKTIAIIAIAATFLLGTTAFAANAVMGGWFAAPGAEIIEALESEQLAEEIGYSPVIIESFENGYSYRSGHEVDNKIIDGETGDEKSFKSASFEYERDGDILWLSQEMAGEVADSNGEIFDEYKGIGLYYYGYTNKIVPDGYEMTAAEKAAEEKGELILSYGDSDIEINTMEVKSVRWTDKGLSFMLMQMGGELSAGEMAEMAKEIIDR